MAKFLTGTKLSSKIQEICQSDNVRCIVAFWGDGAKKYLFGDTVQEGTKIICDLSMGATNPAELREMGAPDGEKIRHVPGLHSKVYMSDAGIVISSANASNNALRFEASKSGHLEAGVFHRRDSKVFKQSKKWFSGIWKNAKRVDDSALENAETEWNIRKWARNIAHPVPTSVGKTTLFQMISAHPEAFNGIKFLFSDALADRKTVAAGLKTVNGEEPSPAEIDNQRKGAFEGWEWSLEKWPERFICIYRSRGGNIELGAYCRGMVIDNPDIHFANPLNWGGADAFPELKKVIKKVSQAEIKNFVSQQVGFWKPDGAIFDASDLKKRLERHGFPTGS